MPIKPSFTSLAAKGLAREVKEGRMVIPAKPAADFLMKLLLED
ncbi:hypothetical protein [Fulvivirga sp.]